MGGKVGPELEAGEVVAGSDPKQGGRVRSDPNWVGTGWSGAGHKAGGVECSWT